MENTNKEILKCMLVFEVKAVASIEKRLWQICYGNKNKMKYLYHLQK